MIFVSNCPARPTKGSPRAILIRSRRFADEHQLGIRIAHAEDSLRAGAREVRTFDANRDPRANRLQ